MPDGGKRTDLNPGLVSRVAQAVRYAVSGNAPVAWFGPMQPLQPMAPADVAGRRYDYPVGYNLDTRPRGNEPVSFDSLRVLADSCDVLRTVIETRKDQMEALDWSVRVRATGEKGRQSVTADQKTRIDAINAFLQSPDRTSTWAQWQRQLLEDLFVIDAPVLYKRRDRGGRLYALEVIDGATVKILLDDTGRRPMPPDPAYQQILKGIPAVDYTADEMLYLMHNPRSHKAYGYSHVEQIIVTVNIAIRRSLYQLEYYREGSQPDAFGALPKEWTIEQIKSFQMHFDSIMAGNSANRRRLRFMPGDFKYQEAKQPPLKDVYDEYLARVICHVFSISPEPFVAQVNRGTAETAHDRALKEGLAPLQRWVKGFMDRVIAEEFSSADLEFAWVDDREMDPKQAADINVAYVNARILSADEVREDLGRDPLGGEYALPFAPKAPPGMDPDGEEKDAKGKQKAKAEEDEPAEKAAYSRLRKADRPKPIPFDRPAVTEAEATLKAAVTAVFGDTAADVTRQVQEALGLLTKADESPEDEAKRIADQLDLGKMDELAETAHAPLANVAADGAVLALAQVGVGAKSEMLTLVNEAAVAYARDRAAEMVGRVLIDGVLVDNPDAQWVITDTTRVMLRSLIRQAIEGGWSAKRLAAEIEDADAFSEERAELIARTETIKASVEGNMIAYRESGVVVGKEWILGAEACDVCVANAEAGVIPLDALFPNGDDAPPAHPNCRCSVIPVTDPELLPGHVNKKDKDA